MGNVANVEFDQEGVVGFDMVDDAEVVEFRVCAKWIGSGGK